MENLVEEELEAYMTRLNQEQKESLLRVIKSFLKEEEQPKFTPEELTHFYERREKYMKNPNDVYTLEEVHKAILENHILK